MHFSRLIRSDASFQEEDELLAEEESSASSLESDEVDCKIGQDLAASSITISNGVSQKETKETACGKAGGPEADEAEASMSERWEAGRMGSMAARLLHNVQVPYT